MTSLFPVVAGEEVDVDQANDLLVAWAHPLGACERPFEQRAHVLRVEQVPVAVTVTASPVSSTCGGDPRFGLVELARIARHPDERWAMRPMLRLWREVFAHQWGSWPVVAAVSYSLPGYRGDIYRWDGWELVCEARPSSGGGTWSNEPEVNKLPGKKKLWRYRYSRRGAS